MNKKNRFFSMNILMIALALFFGSCQNHDDNGGKDNGGTEGEKDNIHVYKAPLYWSVYEYCWKQEKQGVSNQNMDISEQEWDKIIDWVATDLKPYGYDMICTDGFIPMISDDASGYMTRYGSMNLKRLVAKCKAKGLKLGVYDNPLWLHGPDNTVIQGTNATFGDLKYKTGTDKVNNPDKNDLWFSWAVATHKGAKEYIDGFFKHFSEMGVNYIRMDFLSWYENGSDRGLGVVGRGYGRDVYKQALQYICESAQKYGVFTSLVMPHLFDSAALEKEYGNMVRIVADTGDGGWGQFSDNDKGKIYGSWPNSMNMFDGFIYWSKISGRKKVILDGDFIRLNTFNTDEEKQSVISLQLMAGGPVTVADQYNTIGDNLKFYQNEEMLALNTDQFVGKPLSSSIIDANNQIWYGQMSNGDWIIGLFNRNNSTQNRSVKFADLGIKGKMKVRDLWKHTDEGESDQLNVKLSAHACKIVKLTK